MVTVYVWLPLINSPQKSLRILHGHCSMKVGTDYMSWGPKSGDTHKHAVLSVSPEIIKSYDQDTKKYKREAEEQIDIYNLNENVIKEYWDKLEEGVKTNGLKYLLRSRNCSTIVANSLIKGFTNSSSFGKIFLPQNWINLGHSLLTVTGGIYFWSPPEVLELAKIIKRVTK